MTKLAWDSIGKGSSPLARGLLPEDARVQRWRGIIPARAGFTRTSHPSCHPTPDHPRSRGVYGHQTLTFIYVMGSSPLARGLPSTRPGGVTLLTDHPRSRGVYTVRFSSIFVTGGSSPLARGLRITLGEERFIRGIIPARAGFTAPLYRVRPLQWDHPRSRGVYFLEPENHRPLLGSSPLARGLPGHGARGPRITRIIPARAGFTTGETCELSELMDHPRSRGVYTCMATLHFAFTWIIPARAGFTYCPRKPWCPYRDHPRSRGVYDLRSVIRKARIGSSPLARGLRVGIACLLVGGRIIPARAGFTRHERVQ